MSRMPLVNAEQGLDVSTENVVQIAEVLLGKLTAMAECDIDLADGRSYRVALAFAELTAEVDPTGRRGRVFSIETPWATEREWRRHGVRPPSMDDRDAFARMSRRLADEGLVEQGIIGGVVQWRAKGSNVLTRRSSLANTVDHAK